MQSGILARPVVTTVATHEIPEMTEQEVERATKGEIPEEVLARLNTDRRNELVVHTWTQAPAEWNKTLMFATRISTTPTGSPRCFNRQNVEARALHSGTPDRRRDA